MLSDAKITESYFMIDEIHKNFEKVISDHIITQNSSKTPINSAFKHSQSEVMTILVLLDYDSIKDIKKNTFIIHRST